MDKRTELVKQAEGLGIDVDKRWGEDRLRKEIEAKQAEVKDAGHTHQIPVEPGNQHSHGAAQDAPVIPASSGNPAEIDHPEVQLHPNSNETEVNQTVAALTQPPKDADNAPVPGLDADERARMAEDIARSGQAGKPDNVADYIREVEGKYMDRDVVAVEVSHPNAEERVYPGTYSGIRLKKGAKGVVYSDGTKE